MKIICFKYICKLYTLINGEIKTQTGGDTQQIKKKNDLFFVFFFDTLSYNVRGNKSYCTCKVVSLAP